MITTEPIIGTYPRSAAQQFIDAIGDTRDPVTVRRHAVRLGGGATSATSYRFKDMSRAYMTDQGEWKVKDAAEACELQQGGRADDMTTETDLLPMPKGEAVGMYQSWSYDQMRDYARAALGQEEAE